jgi:hypothetical protein
MEGIPLFNQEDNSEDTENDFGADGKPKKKSKKKSGPEWFQKFTAGSEVQPEEESKTNRFLDAIKSPFSRLFGIEKDEVAEDEEKAPEGTREEPEYRLPFMPGAYSTVESVEPEQPETAQDPADAEPELPHGLIIDQETAEDFATWETPTTTDVTIAGGAEQDIADNEPHQPETAVPEELSVDRLRAEVEEHAMASHEVPTERHPDIASYDNLARGESVPATKERELVVEKRGGAGAAAVGFVAADLLSRSRDKKIRKEAKQLKKKVTSLEKKQETDYFETQRLQVQNKERLRDLATKREQDLKIQAKKFESVKTPEARPAVEAKAEKPQATVERVVHREQSVERVAKPEVVTLERQELDSDSTHEALVRQNQELLATIEQAKEVSYAGESYYDRQHEVMDEPTKYDMASGASVPSHDSSGQKSTLPAPSSKQIQQSDQYPRPYDPLPQKKGLSDEYKQAMLQGATTGIILLVGFLVVLILWSLL